MFRWVWIGNFFFWCGSHLAVGQDDQGTNPTQFRKISVVMTFREKGTGISLKRVEVKDGDQVFYADGDGILTLEIEDRSNRVLSAYRKGYEKKVIPLQILISNPVLDIFLVPKVGEDESIIVRGERRNTISKKTVSIQESSDVAPGGDPAQVVKLLPGVQIGGGGGMGSGGIVIRGSGPTDSKYYIDDLEVPFIFHNVGQLSILPPAALKEIQFYSGGFSARYGDATGGIIVLKTLTDIPKRAKTVFTLNIPLYSGVYHERPVGNDDSFLSVGIRRSYLEFFIQKIIDQQSEEGARITISPFFSDAHASYLRKNKGGYRKISLISAQDGIKAVLPTDFSDGDEGQSRFKVNTYFVNLGLEEVRRLSREIRYQSTPQVYYSDAKNSIFDNRINIRTIKFRIPTELIYRLSKKEDFYIGIDPSWYETEVDIYAIRPNFDDPLFDFEEAEKELAQTTARYRTVDVWVEGDKVLGPLKMTLGLRGFHYSLTDKTGFDLRIRNQLILNSQMMIKFAFGKYSKLPEPNEATDEGGNSNLGFEQSRHAIVGVEAKWGDRWTTEVQIFDKANGSVIVSDPYDLYTNSGESKSKGVELFIRRNLTSRLFGWLSYTYSKTEDRRNEKEDFTPSDNDQTHILNLAGSYKLSTAWSMAGRYNYHTGDRYTPVKSAVYNANLDKYQPREELADRNQSRLPDFNSFTIYGKKSWLFDRWKMYLKFGLESSWTKGQVMGVQNNYNYTKEEWQVGPPAIPFIELGGEG